MRWFTADLHLGHKKIIEYTGRPYANVDEMNEALIDNWNSVVGDDDEVWVLGDLALGKLDHSLALASLLRGKKQLIPGNHDRFWPDWRHARSADVQRYVAAGFTVHLPQVTLTFEGWSKPVKLCHLPIAGDSKDDDRFQEHRPQNTGDWLLHGHVHEKWKTTQIPKQINVGVDVWDYTPVSEDQIREVFRAAA